MVDGREYQTQPRQGVKVPLRERPRVPTFTHKSLILLEARKVCEGTTESRPQPTLVQNQGRADIIGGGIIRIGVDGAQFLPGVSTGRDPSRRSGQGVSKISRGESGQIRRCSKSHGSGRVWSGRVRRFSNLAGRVNPIRLVRGDRICEKP